MRLLNILVICSLVFCATLVYTIKFDSTLQAERLAKLRGELARERNAIAVLRAEWGKLDTPSRIRELTDRHLPLKPIDARQFDDFARLPERPPLPLQERQADPISSVLNNLFPNVDMTGSITPPPAEQR